jgi:hypothetical protein
MAAVIGALSSAGDMDQGISAALCEVCAVTMCKKDVDDAKKEHMPCICKDVLGSAHHKQSRVAAIVERRRRRRPQPHHHHHHYNDNDDEDDDDDDEQRQRTRRPRRVANHRGNQAETAIQKPM